MRKHGVFLIIYGWLGLLSAAENAENCELNGYAYPQVTQLTTQLQQALSEHKTDAVLDLFAYPLPITLVDKNGKLVCKKMLADQQALRQNFSSIFTPTVVQQILDQNPQTDPWCKANGVSFGPMWFYPEDAVKMRVINLFVAQSKALSCDEAYGQAVPSSTVQMYDVDINNNGRVNHVFVENCAGSLCTDNILYILEEQTDAGVKTMAAIDFYQVIAKRFKLDAANFYYYHAQPFITEQNKQIYINFYRPDPAQTCTYLWKDEDIQLVNGDAKICLNKASASQK